MHRWKEIKFSKNFKAVKYHVYVLFTQVKSLF